MNNNLQEKKAKREVVLKKPEFTAIDMPYIALCINKLPPIPRLLYIMTLCGGARRNEVRTAKWSQFDLDNATWEIPDENTKTTRSRLVPIPAKVVDLLREAELDSIGSYLFSVDHESPISDIKAAFWQRDLIAIVGKRFDFYDIRMLADDFLKSENIDKETRGMFLNHDGDKTNNEKSEIMWKKMILAVDKLSRAVLINN